MQCWGALILLPVYSAQIVIVGGGTVYIRDYTGNPEAWVNWKRYTYDQ